MGKQSPAVLAELAMSILPPLPCAVACASPNHHARTEMVVIERREGDHLLARWPLEAPAAGVAVELRVHGDAIFRLRAVVVGDGEGSDRLLAVTDLRRGPQRRVAPRAASDELVLISRDREIDAELIDVSSVGLAFLHDRTIPIDSAFDVTLNLRGKVIPARALVRQVKRLAAGEYRIGCEFTKIAEKHRHGLHQYATENAVDRRGSLPADSLRARLLARR
ncbi:MAG: PilZ domain [Gaiellales bacterium]|jgi:hypothetical protein|nr:PilZ domain [Gaiellales bacterium]